MIETNARPLERLSDAASPGEFPGLKAFLAEDGTTLRRLERHRRLLAASRAHRDGFHPLAGHPGSGRTRRTFALAGFAPLGFVLEVLVGEKLLLSRRPDELRGAVHAPEDPVLELHRSLPRRGVGLFRFAPELLPIPFARERLLGPSLVARFQIEGVLLDILDDVFLLNLPLETAESAFDGLALLDFDFSHATNTPFTC